jgi:hypothetical protein
MKTLAENYNTPLEGINRHSLAGLYAMSGSLETAMIIASCEGDVVYVAELMEGIRRFHHPQLRNFCAETFKGTEITDPIKSLFCLAICDYGALDAIVDYAKSKPELWEYILEELGGRDDGDICEFAIGTNDVKVAKKCLNHFATSSFPSTLLIEKLLLAYPTLTLTKGQKRRLIRAAVSGDLNAEEIEVSERLGGRKLTKAEQVRYIKNRFRSLLENDSPATAIDWVWQHQKRQLSKHERALLRRDANETLKIQQEK